MATEAHLHFLPWLLFDARRLQTFRGSGFEPRPLDFGSSGMSPRAPWGPIGVGHVSRITPSSVSANGGAKLTTLASTARVLRSMSSLAGMFMWNLGPSFNDGDSRALMWHSTTS